MNRQSVVTITNNNVLIMIKSIEKQPVEPVEAQTIIHPPTVAETIIY